MGAELTRAPASPHAAVRRAIARRVADAHAGIAATGITALVSGSTADDTADERSDVDMSIVFEHAPPNTELAAACRAAGGSDWFWQTGALADDGLVVAFHVDRIEVQIAYAERRAVERDLDTLLVQHRPDTPLHKLAEGLLKAEPLAGTAQLAAWQARLAAFPPALGDAMVRHFLTEPTPWKAITQLMHRDAALWCRELQVQAAYRLFGVLAGLNRCWFTVFQFKRMHRLAARFERTPHDLAARVEALLSAPPAAAFAELFALEGEVLALVSHHAPHIDLAAVQNRRLSFRPVPPP